MPTRSKTLVVFNTHQCRCSGPHQRASLDRLHPQIEGEDQGEDGNSLIVVRSSHRTRNVRRHDSDKCSSQQTGRRLHCDLKRLSRMNVVAIASAAPHLLDHQKCGGSSVGRKQRCQKHTHVAHIDGDVEDVQQFVNYSSRNHQARVDGPADDSAEWIPCAIIKPVQEAVKTFTRQEFCGAVVEIWIELVNNLHQMRSGDEVKNLGRTLS